MLGGIPDALRGGSEIEIERCYCWLERREDKSWDTLWTVEVEVEVEAGRGDSSSQESNDTACCSAQCSVGPVRIGGRMGYR